MQAPGRAGVPDRRSNEARGGGAARTIFKNVIENDESRSAPICSLPARSLTRTRGMPSLVCAREPEEACTCERHRQYNEVRACGAVFHHTG